jgi:hypothetical protein
MKQLIRKILKEEVSERLKKVIKNKLSKDLSHAEIILNDDGSIWFIDRENKYWYLEFEKSGKLWWRYNFFTDFFQFFSMEPFEFEPIIGEWVEDLLNRQVDSTNGSFVIDGHEVEDLLNRKVATTDYLGNGKINYVQGVLNRAKK